MKFLSDMLVYFFLFVSVFFFLCFSAVVAEGFGGISLDEYPFKILTISVLFLILNWYICFPVIFFFSGAGLVVLIQRMFKKQ